MNRLERLPVPVLPTFVGALTLGNVYGAMNFPWIRHLTVWVSTVVIIAYIFKLLLFSKTCKMEYSNTVPASLHAGFTMILMILGSYYFDYSPVFGKGLWIVGLSLHALHLLVFTYRNVIKQRSLDTFLPCWFVTYNGILVSAVVGATMDAKKILTIIVYYGIIIYFILLPIMIWRLCTVEVKPPVYHTLAILPAPAALCLVGYLNVISEPNAILVYVLYACVFLSVLFVVAKLPRFFSVPFTPGFAGMTFPMAIGVVASTKMAGYLADTGNDSLSAIVTQIQGIQVYITTFIIGFVLLKFLSMALKVEAK